MSDNQPCLVNENNQPHSLNVMALPLHGQRLIEASAGTGKTYTIAGLYLRLLLGHGESDNKHQTPLLVDQILVVTFTEAATSELRERIRGRIKQARHAFLASYSDDFLIKQLLAENSDHVLCAQILLQALQQMDEAAIFTIHGFCQRMLKQHAFESGSYFETEFVTDESGIRSQVIEDFWREHFYATQDPQDYALAKLVRGYWPNPDKLLREISSYLSNAFLKVEAAGSDQSFKERLSDIIGLIDALKKSWLLISGDVLADISSKDIDKRSYSSKNLPKWIDEVTQWAQSPSNDLQVCKNIYRFGSVMLVEKTKSGEAPNLAIYNEIEVFLNQSLDLKQSILAQGIVYARQHIIEHKKQASLLSFDDLLSGLSGALNLDKQGSLAQKIRAQYPLAMIDEFQDTDLMQYQIFDTIYGLDNSPNGLLMIGDPKQAIYSFRGADIFTYIKARRQVKDHYTLDTNYRSSNDMVAAVNALWAQNEAPFIYQQDITFQAVKASNKTQYFSINDQRQGAVSQWIIPTDDAIGSQVYKNAMALACATQVNQLLSDGQLGLANIISIESSAGQEEIEYARGIVASDIAILVRDGSEAHLVKRELAKQGVSSVYLSNRHSVFSATIVSDVWRLMLAILEPTNARLLRSAMACQMMGLSALDLDELNQDERCWQRQVDLFTHWQQRWDKVGILAMLREVIHEQKIAKRLLQLIDGERQLTDLLHLGEILQQQSLETLSEHALAHWLAEKIHDSGQDNLEAQLRLESDRNLVQIVTIHKSKGLEYNLVFLPFICSFKKAKQGVYHQDGQTIVDLSGSSDALKKADKERLAEDLRLIYVALTRAVHHLWLGFAPLKLSKASKDKKTDLHHSAIGYLLLGNQVSTVDDLSRKLSALASEYAFINSQELPLASLAPYRALNDNQQAPQARKFSQTIENNYWITSYSALSKTSHHGGKKDLDASTELTAVDWQSELESIDKDSMLNEAQEALSIFNFPRGAHAGVFLHTLFEEIDFVHAHGDSLRDKVSELLEASEFDEKWLDVLLKLVSDVLDCSLNDGFSLRQLAMKDKQVEMEFFMPLSKFSCDDVNDILTTHDPLSKQAKPLQFMQVQGMLKGFIDLVFVKDNKYYILDYKSNHLGDQCTDYGVDQLSEVMIGHRYDFQYQLYSLALHRLLRSRITDYDYETHFGGVYYLFLRGMEQGQEHNHGIFYNRPSQLLVQELDQLFSEGASK